MNECYKCGISEDKATLYEGIYKTGIVRVCRKCFFQLKIPLIDKKNIDWNSFDSKGTVRDRLENMSHTKGFKVSPPREEFGLRTDDIELKDIVEKNFQKEKIVSKEESTNLIENFHWAIMRKRRSMHFTISELSEKLREPEIIMESLEKGILPRDYESLIKKVENVLGLRLFAENGRKMNSSDIINESKVPTGLMVSEVKAKTPIKDFFFKKKDERSEEEILREKIEKELSIARPEDDFVPEELSLDTINDIVGEPIVPEKVEKIPFEPRYEDTNEVMDELESRNHSPLAEEVSKAMDEIEDKILDEKVYSHEIGSGDDSNIPENVRLAMAELEAEKDKPKPTQNSEMSEEDVRRLAWGN